jgi:methionyl-tRNA formyltransferase
VSAPSASRARTGSTRPRSEQEVRIVFAGTPEFAVPALDALHAAGHQLLAAYTQPDRPAGRGRRVAASAVKCRAVELGVPVEQPQNLREQPALERLARYRPELIVVVAYGLILPQLVLDIPVLGCINIHASILPRWRGAAPIQRAILSGDCETGVTIMKMDAGLDTGPMLLARHTPIGDRETAGELHDRLATLGGEAVVAAIEAWRSGRIAPVPQPLEGATYAAKIRKEEALIDWSRGADEIDRQVRAFNPWPVAETRWLGRQLRVWMARPVDAGQSAPPGQVIEAGRGSALVATGRGALSLERLQLPGGRVLPISEFLKAHDLAAARLG